MTLIKKESLNCLLVPQRLGRRKLISLHFPPEIGNIFPPIPNVIAVETKSFVEFSQLQTIVIKTCSDLYLRMVLVNFTRLALIERELTDLSQEAARKKGSRGKQDEEAHGILEGISSLHSWIKTQTMIRPTKLGKKKDEMSFDDVSYK